MRKFFLRDAEALSSSPDILAERLKVVRTCTRRHGPHYQDMQTIGLQTMSITAAKTSVVRAGALLAVTILVESLRVR